MATPSQLDTLVDLATREVDAAAEHLGMALRIADEAEQKYNMLLQYRADYADRCQANLAAGLSASAYSNYLVFMQKLDHAIAGQQEIMRDCRKRAEEAHTAWVASEQKRMSYGTLATRAQKEVQRKEARRDQKLSDEHASRLMLHKRKHSGIQ